MTPMITIERCKTGGLGVVDVFQAVKALRVQKPGTVPEVVSECISTFGWNVVNFP